MTVRTILSYGNDGFLQGSYVYQMFCEQPDGRIFVKVGVSDKPLSRMGGLLQGLPFEPQLFAYARLSSRNLAKRMESRLLEATEKWAMRGEWRCITGADKEEWRATISGAALKFATPSMPVTWNKVNVHEYRAQANEARAEAIKNTSRKKPWRLKLSRGASKSYRDFKIAERFG